MKHIWQIFIRDLKKILHNPIAVIVAIGLIILPSLYAWFNIAACWDPYGNTRGISVAVANIDEGYSISGLNINVGGMIIDNLAKNDQIGWDFTSEEEALNGVKDGTYYASVIIPKDFSSKITSILTDNIQRPTIDYYVNQKKNAIAPKITDKGISTIQQQVNETFISTATEVISNLLNTADKDFQNGEKQSLNGLIESLAKVNGDLEQFSTSVSAFKNAALAIDGVLKSANTAIPQTQSNLKMAVSSVQDVENLIQSTQTASSQVISSLDDILDITKDTALNARQSLTDGFAQLQTNTKAAAASIGQAKNNLYSVIDLNNKLIRIFKNINDSLPLPLKGLNALTEKLKDTNNVYYDLISKVDDLSRILEKTGSIPINTQEDILKKMDSAQGDLNDIANNYRLAVRPNLDQVINSLYDTLSGLSGLLSALGGSMPGVSQALDGTSTALGYTVAALEDADKLVNNTKTKISGIIADLKAAKTDQRLLKVEEIIHNDPGITAGFMSSPVQVKTVNLYPIANYGSAMTPFYTILCLWVGCLVLVAIIKCHVKEDEKIKNLNPTEIYFGRYLIFLLMACLQALFVCWGDLCLFKIQCTNIPLFILSALVASLVFSNIVYTLTISFGDVGKALAVIFLVLQVAGAGGTFPIEVMPKFFRLVSPLLPFTYGINAMRETIAGIYGHAYWLDILKMLAYLPISLFVGIVLRKPLIKLKHFFEDKLNETEIM
ncbi:MAG: YhgE/Pip domain-containing protein [Clostridiales bacterium]